MMGDLLPIPRIGYVIVLNLVSHVTDKISIMVFTTPFASICN